MTLLFIGFATELLLNAHKYTNLNSFYYMPYVTCVCVCVWSSLSFDLERNIIDNLPDNLCIVYILFFFGGGGDFSIFV